MKGIREIYTTEQLYEELRPRLSISDAWLEQQHPELLRAADMMVEALQKKESYGGGVAQRAAHLAAHLKDIDPVLSKWLERQQALEAAKAAREAAVAAAPAAPTASTAATAESTRCDGGGSDATPAADPVAAAAGAATSTAMPPAAAAASGAAGSSTAVAPSEQGSGGGLSPEKSDKAVKASSSKGGAATALEYLTTTYAHLREQRTLVMGDKKDRLLREVAGLRQMRSGTINVLRGARTSETSMADMLAALKQADQGAMGVVADASEACGTDGAAPMEADTAAMAAVPPPAGRGGSDSPSNCNSKASSGGKGGSGGGNGGGERKGHLDNLTCVVWEDWRVPERLDQLLRAGDTVCVFVEVHCRDGPEDTRLAMRLNTFVSLALCSQRLIAELYQDMLITPQRAAAARPQRKRPRTASEETVQSLDESPDSLDFVDFVEALHRRMPLRCGWMYANAILPTAGDWDRVFGRQAGRLSGLYAGGPQLDALGRSCLAFHYTRHESPVLDVHALASQLRQQQAAAAAEARQRQAGAREGIPQPAGTTASAPCRATSPEQLPPPPPSLILRPPADSGALGRVRGSGSDEDGGGNSGGLDLGHLSFTCVTAAPLSDDFLGEVIRQTTAGQAAAEVAAAAATAAELRASKCRASGRASCTGTCEADAAAAAVAAAAAAAAAASYMAWGEPAGGGAPGVVGGGGKFDDKEEDEELELFEAVAEELQAVEASAVEAEREVELEVEMAEVALAAAAAAAGVTGCGRRAVEKEEAESGEQRPSGCGGDDANNHYSADPHSHPHHPLRGAFSHRMQLMPGVFFSYYIGSQAFTNTAWHVEDFLLQSINLMMVGRPKAWWWLPRDKEAAFRGFLEEQWDAEEVYTKSVPLAGVPLDKLIKMGARRSVQMPGAIFITSPGYAFHTTMSAGWSMADSANFMANILGKDMHVLEDERPLEQYPSTEGRTNTGEWVRFTMRRIEELRARNDPTYTPRHLTRRVREEVQARRAAAAAAAAGVKNEEKEKGGEEDEKEGDKAKVPPAWRPSNGPGHCGSREKSVKVKLEADGSSGGGNGGIGPQQQLQQQQQPFQKQQPPRKNNAVALMQAYAQEKAEANAEARAAAQAAAQRRQARAAARLGQPQQPPKAPPAAKVAAASPLPPAVGGKAKPASVAVIAAPAAAAPPPSATVAQHTSVIPPAQQQQQQLLYQLPFLRLPEHPLAGVAAAAGGGGIDLDACALGLQPPLYSEQELLAGLLPGVLRGLLPELQQQQKQSQPPPLAVPAAVASPVPPAPAWPGYAVRQQQRQQQQQQPAAAAPAALEPAAKAAGEADVVMEEAGTVAMDMAWRVAVA